MADRQYGIPIGYREGEGRRSPPEPPPHAPPQIFVPSTSYPPRDVSPITRAAESSRNADESAYLMSAPGRGIALNDVPQDGHALRDIDNLYNPRIMSPSPAPSGPYSAHNMDNFNTPMQSRPRHQLMDSQSSLAPLAANTQTGYSSPPRSPDRIARKGLPAGVAAAAGAGTGVAAMSSIPDFDAHMPRSSYYHGDGYDYDPANFADDGDDGLDERPRSHANDLTPAAAGAAGAGAGAGAGMLKAFGPGGGSSGNYGPVGVDPEKSAWLAKQSSGNKRLKWIIGISIAILVIGGIVGGVVGGILASKSGGGGSGGSSGGSSGSSGSKGGLYNLQSSEVQAVLNNKNLYKVFPAMDYTPNYAQYPECLSPGGGPIQNNVTIDVAIMSQLTPAIRLYGTDCNQTELVLEAIDRLDMKDTMKVWLGVYLNGNSTTNDRQLQQLYDILDKYDHDYFVGAIIGNEVLFSKYLTETELATQLENVRSNFTSRGINLPVSTADLGDNWTADLASASDIVMSNIHPFFAGELAADAAGWANVFWTGHDVPLTSAKTGTIGSLTYPKQIISEIGWPSEGGNDCGDATADNYGCTSDTDGAVASIDNMNTFMEGWVCDALTNGTTFFWFEAFDEPWKHRFDTDHDKWEPFWGLFDSDRKFKDGLKIPDCGGKTVDKPY